MNMTYNSIINYSFFLIRTDNKHLFDWIFLFCHFICSLRGKKIFTEYYNKNEYYFFIRKQIENTQMNDKMLSVHFLSWKLDGLCCCCWCCCYCYYGFVINLCGVNNWEYLLSMKSKRQHNCPNYRKRNEMKH